jgi:YD repeat-containing protein
LPATLEIPGGYDSMDLGGGGSMTLVWDSASGAFVSDGVTSAQAVAQNQAAGMVLLDPAAASQWNTSDWVIVESNGSGGTYQYGLILSGTGFVPDRELGSYNLPQQPTVSSFSFATSTTTYTYDLNGNRVSQSTTTSSGTDTTISTYNNRNELLTSGPDTNDDGIPDPATADTYTYYDDGSQWTVYHASTDTTDTYTYDLRGRLSSATIGTVSTTYAYDTEGNRVDEITGGNETYFLL